MTPAAWIAVTVLAVAVLALLAWTARLNDLLDDERRLNARRGMKASE